MMRLTLTEQPLSTGHRSSAYGRYSSDPWADTVLSDQSPLHIARWLNPPKDDSGSFARPILNPATPATALLLMPPNDD